MCIRDRYVTHKHTTYDLRDRSIIDRETYTLTKFDATLMDDPDALQEMFHEPDRRDEQHCGHLYWAFKPSHSDLWKPELRTDIPVASGRNDILYYGEPYLYGNEDLADDPRTIVMGAEGFWNYRYDVQRPIIESTWGEVSGSNLTKHGSTTGYGAVNLVGERHANLPAGNYDIKNVYLNRLYGPRGNFSVEWTTVSATTASLLSYYSRAGESETTARVRKLRGELTDDRGSDDDLSPVSYTHLPLPTPPYV